MQPVNRLLAQNARDRIEWEDSVRAADKPVESVNPLLSTPWTIGRKLLESVYGNPQGAAELGLSLAPGSGEAMSARDAWDASGRASNALLSGNYGQAASEYGNVATGILGALPGAGIIARGTKRGAAWMDRNLPTGVNKLLDTMTPQASQDMGSAVPFKVNGMESVFTDTGVSPEGFKRRTYYIRDPAVHGKSQLLGRLDLEMRPDGTSVVKGVEAPGFGKALYDAVEAHTGSLIVPSGALTPDAYGFWRKRNPSAVAEYEFYADNYLSPEELQKITADDQQIGIE